MFRLWLENAETGLDRVWLDHPVFGKETVGEFLDRHNIPVVDGKITLYHGRPKEGDYTQLRAGSYLTEDPAAARHFAARDRGLQPDEVEVLTLSLTPDQIQPGMHITLRVAYGLK